MSHADDHEGTRRDFIYYATAGAGAVVTGAAVWPLVNQMNPSADVRALASIRVDVADVEPGTQLTVKWLGKLCLFVAVQKKKSQKHVRLPWTIWQMLNHATKTCQVLTHLTKTAAWTKQANGWS